MSPKEMTIWDTLELFLTDPYLARTIYQGCKAREGINVLKVIACANMIQRVLLILYQTLILSVVNYGFGLLTPHSVQDPAAMAGGNPEPRYENHSWLYTRHIVWSHAPSTRPAEYAWTKQKSPSTSISEGERWFQAPHHEKVGIEVHSRLKIWTEWTNKASRTFSKCCDVQQVRKCATWQSADDGRLTRWVPWIDRKGC